jgi:hypothetical protein
MLLALGTLLVVTKHLVNGLPKELIHVDVCRCPETEMFLLSVKLIKNLKPAGICMPQKQYGFLFPGSTLNSKQSSRWSRQWRGQQSGAWGSSGAVVG